MGNVYDQRRRPQGRRNIEPERTTAPGPTMDALMSGAAAPTAAQKGKSIDLDAAMKAKMEHVFGDLSAVKLYESRAVGEQVYTGPVTQALSDASPSPAAAGPMQAKRNWGWGKKKSKKPRSLMNGSYFDYEDTQRYNEDTKHFSKVDLLDADQPMPLPEDEDADMVSPEMLKDYQDRTNKKVNELFRIAAGSKADEYIEQEAKRNIIEQKIKKYYPEELEKSKKLFPNDLKKAESEARFQAESRAAEYYKANKPKVKKTVSEQDGEWYSRTLESSSPDFMKFIRKKRLQSAKNLVAYRENMNKTHSSDDKNKLDFESAFSEQSREFSIYDQLVSDMTSQNTDPYLDDILREIHHDPVINTAENMQVTQQAGDLASGYLEYNPYVNTAEGKGKLPIFRKMQQQAYLDMYNSGKKKKKKK